MCSACFAAAARAAATAACRLSSASGCLPGTPSFGTDQPVKSFPTISDGRQARGNRHPQVHADQVSHTLAELDVASPDLSRSSAASSVQRRLLDVALHALGDEITDRTTTVNTFSK